MLLEVVEVEDTFDEVGVHDLGQSLQHPLLNVEGCQVFDLLTMIQKSVQKSEEELSVSSDLEIVLLEKMDEEDERGSSD